MPRLAIVISAIGSAESLESTLVSVLENRPADCEIIVALNRPYSDPYGLDGEVRFVPPSHRSRPMACINQAISSTRAPFVHLLAGGCTVSEAWADAALARFGDRRLASVAPLAMDAQAPERIFAAGVAYRASGRRLLMGRGQAELTSDMEAKIVGPCGFAAFYRKSALEMVGGFSTQLGPGEADVDLALSLATAGYSAVVEPQSRVLVWPDADPGEAPFRRALYQERLFWRNLHGKRRVAALAAHCGLVAWDLARAFPRPRMLAEIAARTLACCQIGSYVRRHAELGALSRRGIRGAGKEPLRVDRPHVGASQTPPAGARAASR